jgi:3-mercaptopyruvate sulfurtransferase SseA
MRKFFLTAFAGAASATLLLAACKATDMAGNVSTNTVQPVAAQPANPADEARRVTVAELQKMLDAGQAAVYDTRPKSQYDAEHIKGALSMPSGEVANRIGELPKDKTIVFYCT